MRHWKLIVVLVQLLAWLELHRVRGSQSYQGLASAVCDPNAAQQCEYDMLTCILFSGPANDANANCNCGKTYHGQCLRDAGCNFAKEVGALTQSQIYVKTCVDLILQYDCPDVLICAVNCASQQQINVTTSKIIPFNNYGEYYLRIRMCNRKINDKRYAQYAMVQAGYCNDISEYSSCSRFIPPRTFIPLAIPIDTTYIEVDPCHQDKNTKTFVCDIKKSVRVYGNQVIWPSSFDVEPTAQSVCASDSDCLGSICNMNQQPPFCQPKTATHVLKSGKYYNSAS